jgi:hypothetical protein
MKIEEITLVKITKTETETSEGDKDKTIYTALFEDKDKGVKFSISQNEEFDLVLGEKYTIKLETEQRKLAEIK